MVAAKMGPPSGLPLGDPKMAAFQKDSEPHSYTLTSLSLPASTEPSAVCDPSAR